MSRTVAHAFLLVFSALFLSLSVIAVISASKRSDGLVGATHPPPSLPHTADRHSSPPAAKQGASGDILAAIKQASSAGNKVSEPYARRCMFAFPERQKWREGPHEYDADKLAHKVGACSISSPKRPTTNSFVYFLAPLHSNCSFDQVGFRSGPTTYLVLTHNLTEESLARCRSSLTEASLFINDRWHFDVVASLRVELGDELASMVAGQMKELFIAASLTEFLYVDAFPLPVESRLNLMLLERWSQALGPKVHFRDMCSIRCLASHYSGEILNKVRRVQKQSCGQS